MGPREEAAMPLRDHFRPPLDDETSWDALHGAWPTVIVMAINPKLPRRYVAEPRVHLGSTAEVDVSTYEKQADRTTGAAVDADEGSIATAVWAPPQPTFA